MASWEKWLDREEPPPWKPHRYRGRPLHTHYWARWAGTPQLVTDLAALLRDLAQEHVGGQEPLASVIRVRRWTPRGREERELTPSDFGTQGPDRLERAERITVAVGSVSGSGIRSDEPELARLDLSPTREPGARLVVFSSDEWFHDDLAKAVSPRKLWSAVWLTRVFIGLLAFALAVIVVSERWLGLSLGERPYALRDWELYAVPSIAGIFMAWAVGGRLGRLIYRWLPPVDLGRRRGQGLAFAVNAVAAIAAVLALFPSPLTRESVSGAGTRGPVPNDEQQQLELLLGRLELANKEQACDPTTIKDGFGNGPAGATASYTCRLGQAQRAAYWLFSGAHAMNAGFEQLVSFGTYPPQSVTGEMREITCPQRTSAGPVRWRAQQDGPELGQLACRTYVDDNGVRHTYRIWTTEPALVLGAIVDNSPDADDAARAAQEIWRDVGIITEASK